MADIFHLWVFLGAVLVTGAVTRRAPAHHTPALALECGSTAAIPANISHNGGRRVGGLYTNGGRVHHHHHQQQQQQQHQGCRSHWQKKGAVYAHIITDVLRRECGAEVSKDGTQYSITVHVQHYTAGRVRPRETIHTLSCHFHSAEDVLHVPVEDPSSGIRTHRQGSRDFPSGLDITDVHLGLDDEGFPTGLESKDIPSAWGGRDMRAWVDNKDVHKGLEFKDPPTELENKDVHVGLDDDVIGTGQDVLAGPENRSILAEFDDKAIRTGSKNKDIHTGTRKTGPRNNVVPVSLNRWGVPVGLDNRGVQVGLDKRYVSAGSDNTGVPAGLDSRDVFGRLDNRGVQVGVDNRYVSSGSDSTDVPAGLDNRDVLGGLDSQVTHSGMVFRNIHARMANKDTPAQFYNKDILKGFQNKDIHAGSESKGVSRGVLSHLFPVRYTSRLVNDLDERIAAPVAQDVMRMPFALPQKYGHSDVSHMTSSGTLLQLNVVDAGGAMTAVVYHGKQVALELHAAHSGTLGTPVVTSCRVTNPLDHSPVDNVAVPPFQASVIHHGCGDGGTLPQGAGFSKSPQGFATPYFLVPDDWTQQSALMVSCDVIICVDVKRCQQKCPPQRRKPLTPGLHDMAILIESQVVTSCPSRDDVANTGDVRWDTSLLPECLPEGSSLYQPLTPAEADQNVTAASSTAGSDANESPSPSSWLAGHLHFIIIIALLLFLLAIFMIATFCKMGAMHRHLRDANKEAPGPEARESERTESEHQDQMTQTPRPLPRTPHARTQTPNRHSRQGGDGASLTVLQLDEGHGPAASRPSIGVPHPVHDSRRSSLPSPPQAPQPRGSSGQPRPQPYDIPPSHDHQQQDFRSSVSSEPTPSGPFVFETSQRSSKVKSFQSSTTVEEQNSERHTTIIEIKTPGQRDGAVENGVAWDGPEHLATFTGGGPSPNHGSGTLERGVVLGVNSLRRHLDRENQQVSSQPRDRRPITAQHHEPLPASHPVTHHMSVSHPVTPQMFYNTPALCSEESGLKELMLSSSPDGGIAVPTPLGGIRTSPHRGSRKGVTPVINTVEETTRL